MSAAAPLLNDVVAVTAVESHVRTPSRFLAPRGDATEPPARVVEYVRIPSVGLSSPSLLRWPVSPHSRIPNWPTRLLFVWALLALGMLARPCQPRAAPAWGAPSEGSR